jgi:hypothetical protein
MGNRERGVCANDEYAVNDGEMRAGLREDSKNRYTGHLKADICIEAFFIQCFMSSSCYIYPGKCTDLQF